MIPENAIPVVLVSPRTTNGGVTSAFINLKNAHKVFLVASFTQAVAHATGIDPVQATVVAGSDAKALSSAVPIWHNTNVASSVLTKGNDAVTHNLAATTNNQLVVFQIDPATLDNENGFDCLGVTVDNSGQATNFVSVVAYVVPRYDSSLDMLS